MNGNLQKGTKQLKIKEKTIFCKQIKKNKIEVKQEKD